MSHGHSLVLIKTLSLREMTQTKLICLLRHQYGGVSVNKMLSVDEYRIGISVYTNNSHQRN